MSPLIWYIAAGSAAGGVARYLLSTAIQQRVATPFPAGTLVVNITGSLALGIVLRYALGSPAISPEMRVLMTTGFLGGYTTFSAFSYESVALIESGDYRRAGAYVLASVVLAVIGTLVGIAIGDALLGWRRAG
jgi:fluoride exporter